MNPVFNDVHLHNTLQSQYTYNILNANPPHESLIDDKTVVIPGTLDYDISDSYNPESRSENLPDVKILFLSSQLDTEEAEFTRRHQNMQAEADEHYRILVQL